MRTSATAHVQPQTFDELFPDVAVWFQPPAGSRFTIMRAHDQHACWNCGHLTHWVDLGFEAFLCGPFCHDEKWAEFEAAYNLVSDDPDDSPW